MRRHTFHPVPVLLCICPRLTPLPPSRLCCFGCLGAGLFSHWHVLGSVFCPGLPLYPQLFLTISPVALISILCILYSNRMVCSAGESDSISKPSQFLLVQYLRGLLLVQGKASSLCTTSEQPPSGGYLRCGTCVQG